jgi:hypothetical protein
VAANVTADPRGEQARPTSDAGRLLVDAVHEWARVRFGEAGTAHIATGATECTWCPICQLIAALRGDRPEVADKLAAAATAVVDVIGALLEPSAGRTSDRPEYQTATPTEAASDPSAGKGEGATAPPAAQGSARPGRAPSRGRSAGPRVQHIDLDPAAAGDADR